MLFINLFKYRHTIKEIILQRIKFVPISQTNAKTNTHIETNYVIAANTHHYTNTYALSITHTSPFQ